MENKVKIKNPINKIKNLLLLPYEQKTKNIYFLYSILFIFLGLLVYLFSFFIIINLVLNNKYQISSKIDDINIVVTPIINLILISFSWTLLIIAPRRVHHNTKQSSMMFYFSFWMLVISVVLNAQLQLTYANLFSSSDFYHWMFLGLMKVIIVISVMLLFIVEIIFWVMRRKFTFMSSDYEIYTERANQKRKDKAIKNEAKLIKKHEKLNAKIAKSHIKEVKRQKKEIKG